MSSFQSSETEYQSSKHGGKRPRPLRYQWKLAIERLKFRRDHRARLPLIVSRFIGYRPPDTKAPYDPIPIPPFTWLHEIPLKYETWLFGFVGAFGSILSIEAIMATDTVFRTDYGAPIVVTSFGASAVLLFTTIESPLSQPRNFLLGHFISALVGTGITRLFVLDRSYRDDLDNTSFHGNTFLNGGICAAFSVLAQDIFGAVHPPAGATGLNAAVEPGIVKLSWRYLPVIIASALVMLGWALFLNNLGRRRYPAYWWEPGSGMVQKNDDSSKFDETEEHLKRMEDNRLRQAENGLSIQGAVFDASSEEYTWHNADIGQTCTANEGEIIEAILRELSEKAPQHIGS